MSKNDIGGDILFVCVVLGTSFLSALMVVFFVYPTPEITDSMFLEAVSNRFAIAHNYTEDYRCLNYSQDFKRVLVDLGYSAGIVIGSLEDDSQAHAWNCVYMDAQHGNFNSFEEYSKDIYFYNPNTKENNSGR